jgi:hypothetical protein
VNLRANTKAGFAASCASIFGPRSGRSRWPESAGPPARPPRRCGSPPSTRWPPSPAGCRRCPGSEPAARLLGRGACQPQRPGTNAGADKGNQGEPTARSVVSHHPSRRVLLVSSGPRFSWSTGMLPVRVGHICPRPSRVAWWQCGRSLGPSSPDLASGNQPFRRHGDSTALRAVTEASEPHWSCGKSRGSGRPASYTVAASACPKDRCRPRPQIEDPEGITRILEEFVGV